MDETINTEQLELKLEEAKKLLRLKKQKLKKYGRRIEAKQHVQETLKRFQTVAESQDDEVILDSSSASESKSSESKSVKFSDDSPEVIFVTPTPDVLHSRKGRQKEKVKVKGYRSLSLTDKKTGIDEKKTSGQIPPLDISQTNAKRGTSSKSEMIEDKVNNNDNKNRETKDMFQSCDNDRSGSSPVLSQCSVVSVTGIKGRILGKDHVSQNRDDNKKETEDIHDGFDEDGSGSSPVLSQYSVVSGTVIRRRISGKDHISHQKGNGNKKETEDIHRGFDKDGSLSPVLSQRSVISATANRQKVLARDDIKHENDGLTDLENDDFFDQDFSEVMEDKVVPPKHSYKNKLHFDDTLNNWIAEDSVNVIFKPGTSDVKEEILEDEKSMTAAFCLKNEWEDRDIFEDTAVKEAEIEAAIIGETRASPKKYPTKEEESQDLFSSVLPTKFNEIDELKRSYRCKLSLQLNEKSNKLLHKGSDSSGRNNSLGSSRSSVGQNAESEIEEENVHRRLRTSRHMRRMLKSSHSSNSNNETGFKKTSGENRVSGTPSSPRMMDYDAPGNCSNKSKDIQASVKCVRSGTSGNFEYPVDHSMDISHDSIETAETQLYSDVCDEEIPDTLDKDHTTRKSSQLCNQFDKCCSNVIDGKEEEKSDACIREVSPKARIFRRSLHSQKAVCAKLLFHKKPNFSDALISGEEFPCGEKENGQCIPESLDMADDKLPSLPQDCKGGLGMDEDSICDKKVAYFHLKPLGNLGEILSGSLGCFSAKYQEKIYVVLVCEFGISLWTRDVLDILKSGEDLPTNMEGDRGGGEEDLVRGNWKALSEKKYQIGDITQIRKIVTVSLTSDDEEIRCLVAVSRNGDPALCIIHLQYDLEGDWLITDRSISISHGDQMNHLFGCGLSDWSVALCWNSVNSSSEFFLVINFDVSYSRRSKKWELHCNTSLRCPAWCSHLRSCVSLIDAELQGYAICTLKDMLYLYNVAENKVVHRIEWNLSPVMWSVAVKDLLFVLNHKEEESKTSLVAVNPMNGFCESFYSWTLEKALSKCEQKLNHKVSLCSASLEDKRLVVLYSNGVVVHVNCQT
ncbi:uncharacterized protein [Palaemon carinicauda]|uniref:uncharacterized protein n=1 Tax=Palaemon carinicauda TaxID=392227 RepID=UPI0035B5D094